MTATASASPTPDRAADARRVVITGLGVVSPFGAGTHRFWSSLLAGESAMRRIQGFSPDPYRSVLGGEVPRSVYDAAGERQRLGSPAEDGTYFAALAAEEALRDAAVGPEFSDADGVGCVLGTLCAGMRNLQQMCRSFEAGQPSPVPAEAGLANYQLKYLAQRHNLTGPSSLVSTACSSTTDALGYAYDLVRSGECEACIAGGGDVLAESIHGAFNGLQSITTAAPKPFDSQRDGFFIGEGAAIFYLETLASARRRGARCYAELLGYGLSNTAHHLTATSEDGSGEALAIERALASAGLRPDQIDFINCHGTGTRHNDASEAQAIAGVFGAHAPNIAVTSNKASIGHCMGAAGGLEALSTALSLYHQQVPPTVHTSGDEPHLTARLVMGEALSVPLRHALSQSFGFGGACSCVVLGRVEELQ